MGWDWVKVLKEEMLDLKSDEHLTRHAATDRLAWVSSQAPARAPLPADDWHDYPGTPPRGSALLGFDDDLPGRANAGSASGFNSGPLYAGADVATPAGSGHPGSGRFDPGQPGSQQPAEGELPSLDNFDFAMPTSPPMEHPAQAQGGFVPPHPGPSLSPAAGPPPSDQLLRSDGYAPAAPAPSGPSYPAPSYPAPSYPAPSHPGLSQAEINQAAQQIFGQTGSEYGGHDVADQGHALTLMVDGVLAGVALPTGTEVTVGRERQCSLVVPEAKQTVSRRAVTLMRTGRRSVEARIENRNGAWVTRDLPEGTRQEFVERGHTVTLRSGDRLSLDPPGTVIVGLGEPH